MNITRSILILLIFASADCCNAQYSTAISKAEAIVEQLLDTYPGISVAVGVGEEIVWKQGFGWSEVDNKIKVDSHHQFRYYSLSKSITGMAISKLIESNELNIELSIRHYLPDLPNHYDSVKIKHLLNHTSGVRHYKGNEWNKISNNHCQTALEALPVFINDPLKNTSGIKKSYSSFGYVLLSRLIAEVSGMSYYNYLQSELFNPLGLAIALDGAESLTNEVKYYSKWSPKKSKASEADPIDNTCKFGGGGLVGTAEDLVKLHLAMINNEITNDSTTEMYYTEIPTSEGMSTIYAFGLAAITNESGYRYHSHSGAALGANGVIMILPKSETFPRPIVVVILGNIDKNDMNSKSGKIALLFKNQ